MNAPPPKTIPVHPSPSVVGPDRLSSLNVATLNFAQFKLFEILSDFDTRKLTKRIEEKPELYFPLINAFCNFSRLQLAREKFEWQKKEAEARQRVREQKQRSRTPIVITVDTVRSLRTLMQATPVPVETPSVQQATAVTVPHFQPARSILSRIAFLELGTNAQDLVPPPTTGRRRSVYLAQRRRRTRSGITRLQTTSQVKGAIATQTPAPIHQAADRSPDAIASPGLDRAIAECPQKSLFARTATSA